jgi:pilus assembly protein FimV
MVRKRLATAVLVTGALHSGFASALGLGELTLSSALNQPFRAEIPLRDIGELDVEQIRIALADDTAFENAGVERSQFLSSLEFQVELQGGGNGRIIVTTTNTVQEPYLDFIVEVRWPNGKMNREYTVLLDLPVFAKASPAPTVNVARSVAPSAPAVKAAVVQDAAPIREPGGSIGVANRTAPLVRDVDQQQRLPAAADPTEYRVQHHDTMWKIAENLRPSSYVTTQQTMLALLKKNPKAFVDGNVNRIKSGYILRIPSEAEVHEINHDQAVDEIRNQAREWRGEKVSRVSADKKATVSSASSSAAPARAPQLDATDKTGREAPAVEEQAVKFSVGSAGSDTAAGNEVEALRQKMREEQENLEKSVLENGAMQARVMEMEKQIRTLQNLITLKNTQLAALQTGLAKGDTSAAAVALADSEEISQDTEQEAMAPLAESDDGSLITSSEPDVGPAGANTPSAPETESPAETSAASSDTSLMATAQAWLSNGFVKFIGLGVAILALLILVLRRRGSETDSEADLAAFEASLASSDVADADVFTAKRDNFDFDIGNTEATELSDVADEDREPSFNADDFDFDKLDTAVGATDDIGMDEGEITVSAVEAESVQPQTGDIVAEADIYVAYGRYDQAASLLKTAIAQDPDNADLHVKLADIYLDTRDRENFTEAFAGLQSLGDAAAIARVKESMSAIDGVSDWLDAEDEFDGLAVAGTSTAELAESGLDFELDEDLDFELSDVDADNAAPVGDNVAPLENDDADDLDVDFADVLATGTAGVEQGSERGLVDDVASESEPLDDSIRNAEADALASLDVDLADLDFDFEPSSAVSGSAAESEKASFDLADFDDADLGKGAVADVEAPNTTEDVPLVSKDESAFSDDDDFEFDFAAFDEAEEADASAANGSEPDTLPPRDGASTEALSSSLSDSDLDLDLDLTAFDAENDADLDLDLADFDTPLSPVADLPEPADLGAVLAADDEFFVDASEGEAELENAESASAETTSKANDGEGIAVEDLSFDEFDADDGEGEFDNLLDTESVATKLDLARAYVDMGDSEGAREMLEEVLVEGDIQQQNDAQALLDIIG